MNVRALFRHPAILFVWYFLWFALYGWTLGSHGPFGIATFPAAIRTGVFALIMTLMHTLVFAPEAPSAKARALRFVGLVIVGALALRALELLGA
jgi:hypothetical protein